MATRIQLRRGTLAQWTAANPILASGEIGIELDTFQWKVGNGTTAWNSLAYVASGSVILPEGGDLDDVPDGTLYNKIQAAFAAAINGETFDAASVLAAGIGGAAKVVATAAIDAIAISGIHTTYSATLGPFPGYTTYIISSVADANNQLQFALKQSSTAPQLAVRVKSSGIWYSWVMFDNVQAALNAGVAKTVLVDADVFMILDSEASNTIKKTTWANLKAKILAAFGVQTAALTAKAPPVDADMVAVADSESTNATVKVTFTAIWTWIQSKFAGATAKATPVDADKIALTDTEASNATKTMTFANLWTWVQAKLHGATNKAAIVDADKFPLVDTEAANATKSSTWANIKAKMWAAWGGLINGGTAKSTLADADMLSIADSADTNATKKILASLLTRRVKMPDGAAAVYASNFATTDGWVAANGSVAVTDNILRLTASAVSAYIVKSIAISYKTIFVQYRTSGKAVNIQTGGTVLGTLPASTTYHTMAVLVGYAPTFAFLIANSVSGDWLDISNIWVGDYSYLPGSLSEEAARIADQLGDTAGVGAAATATITATDVATATKGDTIHGKKYTFVAALTASPGVEGEVLKGANKEEDLANESLAISEAARTNNGTKYWAATVHPTVSSAVVGAVMTLTAKTAGILGNQITVACESGTNHTASGTTLSGGIDAVGAKVSYQVARASQQLEAKTSGVAADYEMLLDSANGFIKKKVLKSNLETATQTAGKRVLFNPAKGINVDGISFPAIQAPSADTNTLDDYEEGVWTPTIAGSTTPGVQTYMEQNGFYVKVGKRVKIDFTVSIAAKDVAIAGTLRIAGLPFTSTSQAGYEASGVISNSKNITLDSGYTQIESYIPTSYSKIVVSESGSANIRQQIVVANVPDSCTISGSIEYLVS